jgi:hypothetical protein
MSGLFGNSENAVTSALSAQSGLGPDVTSTLMAMAGPMVMSFIGGRVRAEGMTMSGLGSLLRRESATFRSALPTSLRDQFWPRAATDSPVVAQAVEREKPSTNWLPEDVKNLGWNRIKKAVRRFYGSELFKEIIAALKVPAA